MRTAYSTLFKTQKNPVWASRAQMRLTTSSVKMCVTVNWPRFLENCLQKYAFCQNENISEYIFVMVSHMDGQTPCQNFMARFVRSWQKLWYCRAKSTIDVTCFLCKHSVVQNTKGFDIIDVTIVAKQLYLRLSSLNSSRHASICFVFVHHAHISSVLLSGRGTGSKRSYTSWWARFMIFSTTCFMSPTLLKSYSW